MKCPSCETENPDTKKFCRECGSKLILACPECGAETVPGDKFCGECGKKLYLPSAIEPTQRDLSFEEKLERIQRYLPKGLTEKILAQRDRIEGERKQVTVMFCDMEEFTALSEKLGPEDAYSVVDEVYEILIHKVHDYEGTVNEMTGDGIMALFGAPIALEDAAQRAIRSSLSIHREMTRFTDRMKQNRKDITSVKMRIGIHTGPVIVGTVGNNLRVEFKAVGDTVNLASRMEQLAEPGTTYVTEQTFRLTEGLFRFEAMGEREIKGRKEHVKAYRPIAPSTRRTRFDISTERGLTEFVGRERELELLLDGFMRSKTSRGQAVSIIAEAGVGKSRLLYEFRKAVANEDVTFLEGRCLSYSRGVIYHPIIDIVKGNFDIKEEDGELDVIEKIRKGLDILKTDEALILPYLLELLSVRDSGIEKMHLSLEAKKDRIHDALKRTVLRGSEIRPLIMAFENLHWIDQNSEEYLRYLLDNISGARVFLIFTYRPQFVHTWGGRSYHSQINLNRLSNRETLRMVSQLLGTDMLDNEIEQLILEKTEGVPFFIEELISSLKDQKIIEKKNDQYRLSKNIREVTIPSTIQDVIMARVDSLPEGAKGLLQSGAVVGREFSHNLIKAVTKLPEEKLLSHISVLKNSELIYERGIYPQSEYVFKHALSQGVAYNSLILKKRREIHEIIGNTLEQFYSDKQEELAEVLAYHFLQAEDWLRAYIYNQDAGLKAFSLSAYEEAQRYFEDALAALKKLPEERTRIVKEIDLRFHMRSALLPLGRHEEWGNWIRGAESLAKEIEDDDRLSNALNNLSRLEWVHGRYRHAIELAEKALILSERTGHFSNQIGAMLHLGIFFFAIGDFPKQIELHQEVCNRLTGAAVFQQHGLVSVPAAFSRGLLALSMAELGKFDKIEKLGRESIEIAEVVQNSFTLVFTYTFCAMAYLRIGKLVPALPILEKAYDLCRSSKVQFVYAYTAGSLGYAYLQAKEPERALSVLKECTRDENLQASFWTTHTLTVLAEAYCSVGDFALAAETVSRTLKLASEHEERGFETWALLVMARINEKMDKLEEAIQWYQRASHQASSLSMVPLVGHCHKGIGKIYSRLGNKNEAQLELESAAKIYKSLGMQYWMDL